MHKLHDICRLHAFPKLGKNEDDVVGSSFFSRKTFISVHLLSVELDTMNVLFSLTPEMMDNVCSSVKLK